MSRPDLSEAERAALDDYREFVNEIADMRSAVLVLEEIVENTITTPAPPSMCHHTPGFIPFLLNEEERSALHYAIGHVGNRARALLRGFEAIEPGVVS